MTTPTAIRREMLYRVPELGRVLEEPSSITTTTVVVDSLAVGSWSEQKFVDEFMARADAASVADRVRRVSAFTASSGTLTHAGANYSDVTATGELVELLKHEPYLYDTAIDLAIRRLRREDRTPLPTVQGSHLYWLHDLDWIEGPEHIVGVLLSHNPVFSKNRRFEKWNGYDSSGNLEPDYWTLAGSGGTVARESTVVETGQYSAKLTRAGTDLTFTQEMPLLVNGVSGDSLRGKDVTVAGRLRTDTASTARLRINDGVTVTTSDYHSGGDTWEELSATATINDDAASLSFGIEVNDNDTNVYGDDCYTVETLDDAVRRDAYPESPVLFDVVQGAGSLRLDLPMQSRNSQYVVVSTRPYPGLVESRLRSGAADADTTDAPLEATAVVAIAILYGMLKERQDEDTGKYAALAFEWGQKADRLLLGHTRRDPHITPPLVHVGPMRRGVRL